MHTRKMPHLRVLRQTSFIHQLHCADTLQIVVHRRTEHMF